MFTYDWYRKLINIIEEQYIIKDWTDSQDGIIIRHDIDYDLKKAYEFARFEEELGVKSTYFLLLTGDFYNVFSENARNYIQGILKAGHKIGLHFDETKYPGESDELFFQNRIIWEAGVLTEVIEEKVQVVSMHRPSERMLDWNINIPDLVNTYSIEFFKNFKYYSDSRRRWREPVISDLMEKKFKNIQILIHPFWYLDEERDIQETISVFVNSANQDRYDSLKKNIIDLEGIMKRSEVR